MTDIIYVDKNDTVIGSGPRIKAIEDGIIHRIIRVLVFNSNGDLLLQKRSKNVDMPGRWDQSVGGHVDAGEDYLDAAIRETEEELGVKNVELKKLFKYYREENENNQTSKKRFEMIYKAEYNGKIVFNPEEIAEVRWISPTELVEWMKETPKDFTDGFIFCFDKYSKL